MHFSTLAAAVIAAAPSLVAAEGQLGWALGTKHADGSCKYTADYEADFRAIKKESGSTLVRGYSADDCNFAQQILPAAKNTGTKVVLGVWPDVQESFRKDTDAIKKHLPGYEAQVHGITVGSETLYRGNFTGQELLTKINQVKAMFPDVAVGTADSWNKYADGTANAVIEGGVDLLYINAFAFWQGQTIHNATNQFFDDIMQATQVIQDKAKGRKIDLACGESGWPSDGGTNYEAAKAGTANAKTYYRSAVCGLRAWGVNVFYFEAFDEPWKPDSVGDSGASSDETHWGAMTAGRKAKFNLKC
ncbi:MAG: glycoside hydrolase 3 protein [Alyxoria varia]|nr:MAG: glycoside hydrolase 3 protein [Alyxoria varia]